MALDTPLMCKLLPLEILTIISEKRLQFLLDSMLNVLFSTGIETNEIFRNIQWILLSVASDNTASVYLNNVLVDTDPAAWHEAAYWNR